MLLLVSVILSTGRGSLYDVTSSLTAWSHVPSRGSLFLVPRSFQGGSVSGPMFIPRGVSVSGPMFPRGVSLTSLHRDPSPGQRPSPLGSVKSGWYASYWNAFLFHINLRSLLPLIVLLHVIFLSNLYRLLHLCLSHVNLLVRTFESRSERKPCRIHISRPDS